MLKSSYIFLTLFFLGYIITPVLASPPITINAEPCFLGMAPNGFYPLKITVNNSGGDVSGSVKIQPTGFAFATGHNYSYPVDLPSQTSRQLIAYPRLKSFAAEISV